MYQVRMLLCDEKDLGGTAKVKTQADLLALRSRVKCNPDVVAEKLGLVRYD